MGLIKNLEQPTGVIVTYWEIACFGIQVNFNRTLINEQPDPMVIMEPIPIGMDMDEKSIQIYMYGYLDKASRESGKKPITSASVVAGLPETVSTTEDMVPMMYQLVKANANWSDAVDA
jgi:hypothetical protein